MRRLLLTLPLAFAATVACANDDSAFFEYETTWNVAHLGDDPTALETMWADDLVLIVPHMPPMSKADALDFWRKVSVRFTRYETSDIRVRRYGGAAIVTGRLLRSRDFGGRTAEEDWRFTKVYAKTDGAWRVVSFHASESPEE